MEKNPKINCPHCGTEDVYKNKYSARALAISVLLLGFPIPFLKKTYYCFECRLDFKKPKDED